MKENEQLKVIIKKYYRQHTATGYTKKYADLVALTLVLAREVQARRNRYGILRARYATDKLLRGLK